MQLACLTTCDALVFGSHAGAMALALQLAREGQAVVLAAPSACLYEEQTRSGDFRFPQDVFSPWGELLYPDHVRDDDGLMHPDRLKRHGEDLMCREGVQLLYAVSLLGFRDGYTLLAHKSGPCAIRCSRVYDCTRLSQQTGRSYCLHIMQDEEHRQLFVPVNDTADDPHSQYHRYQTALSALPEGATLARGGISACPAEGFSPAALIHACLALPPMQDGFPAAEGVLQAVNPVRDRYAQTDLLLPRPQEDASDVLIVGGGTSGAAAALFCARMGLKTRLIEMNQVLGGTATIGGVSTYWFGYRGGASEIIDRAVADCCRTHHLPRKACLWNEDDVFLPDVKAHVLLGLCLEAGVDVRFGCIACAVERTEQRIGGVYYAWQGTPCLTRARMVIDCTGDGDIAMLAGAAHTYGNKTDGMTYWGSLAQFIAPHRYKNNFSTMVHVGDPLDYTRFIIAGRTLGPAPFDHGQYVAVRESRHIHGLETLTLEDIVSMKSVDDPLYVCFSNYDPKGRLTAEMCYFGLLPPNQRIPIPRGTVIPVDEDGIPFTNLLAGGKAISCTHDALPGVRMQPDLQQQGLALAALTRCCLEQHALPWEASQVRETILHWGGDFPDVPQPEPLPLTDVINALDGHEAWQWLDDPVTTWITEVPPVIRVMTAPREEVVPLLRCALDAADTPEKRLTLSRLLLWHRDECGADAVLSRLQEMLQDALPRRTSSVNYGQMLPDHGLMPEAVYLLNALAYAPDRNIFPLMQDVLTRLENMNRDWYDLRAGIYCWCESFAFLALRRKDKSLIPLLHRLLMLPEFTGTQTDPLLCERLQMLRLTLLHALHCLGSEEGTRGLLEGSRDKRLILALAAEQLLHH